MPVLPLRHPMNRLLPALLTVAVAAAGALALTPAPAFAAPGADPQVTADAATWLAGRLASDGTVVGSYEDKGHTVTYTDYGRTVDADLALLAARGHDDVLGRSLTSVEQPRSVAAYTQGAPGDRAGAAYVGATAKLAFLVQATGGDPTTVGGVDLIAQLTSLETPAGRLADRSSFGDYANVFGHAFALLALQQSGRTPSDALVQGLLSAHCPDGSFPETYPKSGTPCSGSVDATGLVLQALVAVGQTSSSPAAAAVSWLRGRQGSDGHFPGQAPVNSTGYAVLGLDAAAASTGNAIGYLRGQQNADGGLRTGAGTAKTSDLFATAQAIPALVGTTFAASARTVRRLAVLSVDPTLITAPGSTRLTVHARANIPVDLYAYSRPATTFRVIRSARTDADGMATFAISLLTNTRLYAQPHGVAPTQQVVVGVRTALTMSATRTRTRTFVFSGRSNPARPGGLVVSLYRFSDKVHQVLTAQARADAKTGNWSLTRTFTGTGQFVFVVRTGNDLQNAAGSSSLRSVRIS